MNKDQEKENRTQEVEIPETNKAQKSKSKKIYEKISKYFSSIWNCIEFIGLTLYYIGLILRFIPNNINTFIAAR